MDEFEALQHALTMIAQRVITEAGEAGVRLTHADFQAFDPELQVAIGFDPATGDIILKHRAAGSYGEDSDA